MSTRFNYKQIADSVHGSVGLSKLEIRIIQSRAFQRLRNVKQLGLAHYVFPSADYSRFTHCIGVAHVAGEFLQALVGQGEQIDEETIQLYRLSGLLHDIGHYPFSHAFEEALSERHADAIVVGEPDDDGDGPEPGEAPLKHEEVSKAVITRDEELSEIFEDEGGIEPEAISRVFRREGDIRYSNLISSDLDADRVDYLLRTAKHTGLPYGQIDLDYLLKQVRIDDDQQICFHYKAMRTAEHFLVARFFDYQQVVFHKTVAAFEWLLRDLITELLDRGALDCSPGGVKQMIDTGIWAELDDVRMMNMIRELRSDDDAVVAAKAAALLDRNPPRQVAAIEHLAERDPTELERHARWVGLIQERIERWADRFDVNRGLWYVWSPKGLSMTKASPQVSIDQAGPEFAEERYEEMQEAVRIFGEDCTSQPIWAMRSSLMKLLGRYRPYSARVYVLLPRDRLELRTDIADAIYEDLPGIEWGN